MHDMSIYDDSFVIRSKIDIHPGIGHTNEDYSLYRPYSAIVAVLLVCSDGTTRMVCTRKTRTPENLRALTEQFSS